MTKLEKFDLGEWINETAWDKRYWSDVHTVAFRLQTDGCSGVPDWLVWTCWEHDIHYRTHRTIDGYALDKAQADYIFRRRLQQGSGYGYLSFPSWWRWIALRVSRKARRAWDAYQETAPEAKGIEQDDKNKDS